jgi:hypothetical protein
MSLARPALLLAALLALAPATAPAQSRPDEDAMFGGAPDAGTPEAADAGTPPEPERPSEDSLFGGDEPAQGAPEQPRPAGNAKPDQPPAVDEAGRERQRDEEALSGPGAANTFDTEESEDEPLRIGGFFYLRAEARADEASSFGNTPFAAPTLVDGYFDARPTDRIRAFVVARLTNDPTNARPISSSGAPSASTAPTSSEARIALDQAWLRFDVARQVFLTLGKQHVKWGVGRFWNPTDFLTPQRLDPLEVFDERTGASMVKLHVPWEARGWNFYAIGLLDNAGPASTVGQVGGALRAEIVLGPAELGVSGVLQRGRRPRLGLDASSAVGPFDLYAEAALKTGSDVDLYRLPTGVTFDDVIPSLLNGVDPVDAYRPTGLTPQATVGVSYDFAYSDTDRATVGFEYFYNSTGYTTYRAYPYLLFKDQFQPFYLGEHYAGAYLALLAPGSWENTTFTVSTLGNLSDRSFLTRLDVSQRVLRYLTLNAFVAGNYGQRGGEFRFAVELPSDVVDDPRTPEVQESVSVPAPTVQLGVGLRINI